MAGSSFVTVQASCGLLIGHQRSHSARPARHWQGTRRNALAPLTPRPAPQGRAEVPHFRVGEKQNRVTFRRRTHPVRFHTNPGSRDTSIDGRGADAVADLVRTATTEHTARSRAYYATTRFCSAPGYSVNLFSQVMFRVARRGHPQNKEL